MEILFNIIRMILAFAAIISIIPTILIIPSTIITGIISFINKDKKYLKLNLKIWGYSLILLIIVFIIHTITIFIFTNLLHFESQNIEIIKNKNISQYCDYTINWDSCDRKEIKVTGTNPIKSGMISQHPIMTSPNKEFQSYIDIVNVGQVILLSKEKIDCPDKMTVIGTLSTNVGPCDPEAPGKNSYCGSSITVNEWGCN